MPHKRVTVYHLNKNNFEARSDILLYLLSGQLLKQQELTVMKSEIIFIIHC